MMAKSHSIRKTAVAAALAFAMLGTTTVFASNIAQAETASPAQTNSDSLATGQILSIQQDVEIIRQESGLLEAQVQQPQSFVQKADEIREAENRQRKLQKQKGVATGKFLWPVPSVDAAAVSSGVGYRDLGTHNGIDILAEQGSDILASDGGVVYISESNCTHYNGGCGCGGGYGNYVMIDHGNGYFTTYGHMTETLVQTGDKVSRGQKIGTIGSTGYSTGFHLHFELRQGFYGAVLNPLDFITDSPQGTGVSM